MHSMHITLSMHFNSSTRRVVCTVHVCTNVGYKVRFAPYTTYSRLHSSCQYVRATCYSSKYTYYAYYVASTCILFRGGYLYIYIYPSFSSFLFWFWSPFHQNPDQKRGFSARGTSSSSSSSAYAYSY